MEMSDHLKGVMSERSKGMAVVGIFATAFQKVVAVNVSAQVLTLLAVKRWLQHAHGE